MTSTYGSKRRKSSFSGDFERNYSTEIDGSQKGFGDVWTGFLGIATLYLGPMSGFFLNLERLA